MGSRGPRRCSKCNAPVAWWRNEAQREETWMLVDLSSDPAGTVRRTTRPDPNDRTRQIAWGRRLSGLDLAEAVGAGEMLFTLHATTCTARRPRNPKPAGVEIVRLSSTAHRK